MGRFLTSIAVFVFVLMIIPNNTNAQNFNKIDAVTYNSTSNTWYFFSGEYYLSKKAGENVSSPKPMSNWAGWNDLGWTSIRSVVYNGDTETYYFFRGQQYARKRMGEPIEAPRSTYQVWEDFPTGWVNGPLRENRRRWRGPVAPDAVLYNEKSNNYYFFKGNFYARKPLGEGFDLKHPILYRGNKTVIEAKWYDAAGAGAANVLFNAFDLLETDDTEFDEFVSDGSSVIPPNNFGTFWPRDWRLRYYNPTQFNKYKEVLGVLPVAAGVFNPDTNKYYFFVNTEDGEIQYWTKPYGRAEQSYPIYIDESNSEFYRGWPRSY